MADLWDSRPGSVPQPELNPLTNSVLERNLDRWAKVYFGNPPGKREEAVSKLLEQIRREFAANPAIEPVRPADLPRAAQLHEVVCPVCQRNNPPGHKFCGRCGAALGAEPSESGRGAASTSDDLPAYSEKTFWRPNRILDSGPEPEARTGQGWKYLAGTLAIVLAGFAYLQWSSKHEVRVPARSSTAAPRASALPASLPEHSSPSPASRQAEEISAGSSGSELRNSPAAQKPSRSIVPGVEPASQKSRLLDPALPHKGGDGAESGGPDLRLAQRYLGGSMGARDSSEAAKLLWKAVRKQNTAAAVMLSDLYLRGDGVSQSCDQARLLLLAAAKRGAPQAIQQLQNLEAYGCR